MAPLVSMEQTSDDSNILESVQHRETLTRESNHAPYYERLSLTDLSSR